MGIDKSIVKGMVAGWGIPSIVVSILALTGQVTLTITWLIINIIVVIIIGGLWLKTE